MKMKKLSVKALMSLILSAILFCMPVGAFFANRANTVVHQLKMQLKRSAQSIKEMAWEYHFADAITVYINNLKRINKTQKN